MTPKKVEREPKRLSFEVQEELDEKLRRQGQTCDLQIDNQMDDGMDPERPGQSHYRGYEPQYPMD